MRPRSLLLGRMRVGAAEPPALRTARVTESTAAPFTTCNRYEGRGRTSSPSKSSPDERAPPPGAPVFSPRAASGRALPVKRTARCLAPAFGLPAPPGVKRTGRCLWHRLRGSRPCPRPRGLEELERLQEQEDVQR